ncbi:MAG: hypothetical protein ACETWK_04715 [Candidatus Aminicenantaceae bacterium]
MKVKFVNLAGFCVVASIVLGLGVSSVEVVYCDKPALLTNLERIDYIKGDYFLDDVRKGPEGRTHIYGLVHILRDIGARDYMHLVWKRPWDWEDFELMAPIFQERGIRLWLYLTAPTEGEPEPFGGDYVRWAVECAKLAEKYPIIKGLIIDDFATNVKYKFTPDYCKKMMDEARKITPHLALLVAVYYGWHNNIKPHVEKGAIDGVILPYLFPHCNHHETQYLLPQITEFRKFLDDHTNEGGVFGSVLLVVAVYATRCSVVPEGDNPTPEYVKKCLTIALNATNDGLADGVYTYWLPKLNPAFVEAVTGVYRRYK